MLRIEVVHSFDERTHRHLDRLIGAVHRLANIEENIMPALNDLAVQIAKDAKDNDDAFAALNAADEARATRLKAAIDALKAAGGNVDPAILAQFSAVHDSLTGTSGKMIAAAALANTDAASDVPAAAASTVPA